MPLKIQNAFLGSGQTGSKLVDFAILSNHHLQKIQITKHDQYQTCQSNTLAALLSNPKKGTNTSKE